MELTKEQLELLKKPLPPEAVSPHPTKKYLSSIKAIYVVERLNEVFKIGGWRVENTFVEKSEEKTSEKTGHMIVVKSVFNAEDIYIEAFGGNDNIDLGDAYKGACTDALTKIGSYLEIGMDVFKGKNTKPATIQQVKQTYTNNPDDDNKEWMTDEQFKKSIKTLQEKGTITIASQPKEIMKILRTRYKVAKKYEEMIPNELAR